MATIEVSHNKVYNKIKYLENICEILNEHTDIKECESAISKLCMIYNEGVAEIINKYYESIYQNDVSTIYLLQEKYDIFMISENIPRHFQKCYQLILRREKNIPKIEKNAIMDEIKEMYSIDLDKDDLHKLKNNFEEIVFSFNINKIKIKQCNLCGSKFTIDSIKSELQCKNNECNQIVLLSGVIFDDSQMFNQQNNCIKTKRHDPNGHCSKWLIQLQADEEFVFKENDFDKINKIAIREYTKNGKLMPMNNLKCLTVRNWLKQNKMSEYYDHAPLLRKKITALHGKMISPPKLTPGEKQSILLEYSLCMHEFEFVIRDENVLQKLGKTKVKNKFYYPYILWKLLNLQLDKYDDRRLALLECIHLQSENTIKRNDIVWKEICNRRKYTYKKTNMNIF